MEKKNCSFTDYKDISGIQVHVSWNSYLHGRETDIIPFSPGVRRSEDLKHIKVRVSPVEFNREGIRQ